jgi:hypothetical protein
MTFRQWSEKYCVNRGMFPDQAAAVIAAVISDPVSAAMADRWNDDTSVYPVQMMAVIALNIDRHALAWIDTNLPHAFFRPMFDPKQARALGIA